MRDVYVAAIGLMPFGRHPDKSVKALTSCALDDLWRRSPIGSDRLGAAWFANAGWGMQTGQHCIRGQVALAPLGIDDIPIMNVENACAGGASAFHGAYLGVAAGAYDIALAVGAEKTFVPKEAGPEAKAAGFKSFLAGTDVEVTVPMIEQFQADAERKRAELAASGDAPEGDAAAKGKEGRSPFMDIYSVAARAHMSAYGTTQEQLAAIAAKNHHNGARNPVAQYQMDMTVQEVLDDRLVSFPLTRAMCAPIGDGAAAALLVSGEVLDALDRDASARANGARRVRVRASALASGSVQHGGLAERASRVAYEQAGVGPDDIDVAEVHDATAFGELAQTEALGFCGVGDGGPFAASGATALGGSLPVNPSGGLECRGHPIGATGLAQIAEIVLQLQGDAGDRQVEGARIGLTENGGGFLGMGEAAVAIHLLEAVGRT